MTIKIINTSPHSLPEYKTIGSAGMDLVANIPNSIVLKPTERRLIPTGLFMELPNGFEAQIRPRSGLALKNGITCLNTPGTIDSDYRGEVGVILINLSNENFTINNGDRIAQMIIAPYEQISWKQVDLLETTHRGEGGFGSTGIKNTEK
jgi:dUTP pyrophosphatase